ncbi:unnamed protein product [Nezara viridula]|uniref:MRH domain-containing protein n=1 Tax=Nezara viridula TaxID=85310 RepID=A0A9P0HEB8_NEZVI|nr:unnamed protein product [Nezara viridula]
MSQRIFFIVSLCVLVTCSDYKFENCILHSRSDTVIIDLSDNLEDDSWFDVGPEMPNSTYYFSLCPKVQSKCPDNGFFCLKLNGTILDLASTFVGTSEVMDGSNIYHYMLLNGKHGSGKVNIQCDESRMDPVVTSLSYPPTFKDGHPYFDYLISWRSSSNCPLKHFSVKNNCILYTHPRSYDLRPLRKTHQVKVADKDYIINICEILSSNCSSFVCEVDNSVVAKPLSNAFELSYVEHKGLSFSYPTLTGGKIVINLICSLDQEDFNLNLVSNNKEDLVFSINTPLVCDFHVINCLLHAPEKNIAYDLYPLNKMIDNYEWKLSNGKRLLLNVCGPLNYIPQVACADGLRNFGCIIDANNQTEATVTFANVTVIGPGHIAMVYNSKNLGKSDIFINISFKCSKHVSVTPTVSRNDVSRFNIDWNTYAACPLKYSAGKNCEVENLYNQSKVNLMPLHKKKLDYFIVNEKESFRINVCGGLTQRCSRNPNAAVCFKNSNGTELAIGDTGALEPNFIDGQFIFNLEGEPCHDNATKSRIKIIMACEFSSNNTSIYSPELFPNAKENECMYYFYWKTPLVCGSSVSSKCTYSNEVVKYDLSSLINLRENYIINYNDSEIELNICHSLIPGHRMHCHEWSGACLKNHSIKSILSAAYDNHENNENLGMVSEQDDFDLIDNKIRLYYKNGGVCRSSEVETVYSTTIDFICDKTASDSEPILTSVKDCHYNVSWTTSAACPTYKSKAPCSINISNKTFDLSNFMDKTFPVQIENSKEPLSYEITIGICRPVDTIGCSGNSGSCLFKDGITKNLGNYNSKLQYVNESLRLVYEADNCKSTVIEFSCGQSESSGPLLIKRNNCTTSISWSTRLACPDDYELSEMKCCQGIEDICEKLNQTYILDINEKEKAFINICKPLLPKWGIMCPSGSVSCLANNESLDSFSSEKSLGSFMLPPVLLNDKTAIIKYFDGSVCHKDSETRYSTSITFLCDENAHIGRPMLINISDDCQYEFKWATSLMCHEKCSLPIGNKNIYILEQFQNWDKRIFLKNGLVKSPYILNLCQVSARCGSHICKLDHTSKWLSFAESNSYQSLKVSDSETRIFYKYLSSNTSKDSCGAQVDLICDNYDRGPGRPYLEEERDCFIHVVWKSNLACFSEKNSESSSNIAVWCVFSLAILAFAVIIAGLLRYNSRLNLGSCLNRILGYRRDLEIAELQM